jgi:hypothetical protein
MLLKSPLSIAPVSGFVAFDGGGAVDVDAYRSSAKARVVALQPALPVALPVPEADTAVEGMRQSASWQPAGAARSRRVEGAVIIAICAYFVFGFAGLAHWI